MYAVWPYEFKDCVSVNSDWWFRVGYDTDGSGSVNTWQPWYTPGDTPGWWFYSLQHKKMCMCSTYSSLTDTIVNMMWYQVHDRRTNKTILTIKCDRNAPQYPMPSDVLDCSGPLPIESQIQTQLPTDPVLRRTFVAWPNTDSITSCGDIQWQQYYTSFGLSESPAGSTVPRSWSPFRTLDQTNFHMVWPTYNAVLWSPDDANSSSTGDVLRRLWFKVNYPIMTNDFIPPTRLEQTPPFYNYPSGDGILC